MSQHPAISLNNTEYAFAYKSNKELKLAKFLFSSMGYNWIVKIGTSLTPWALKIGLPVKGLIRKTIFRQFVGGETLAETASVADRLQEFGVKVILDYGVEGKEGESNFDHACDEFIRVINYAASQPNMPFMSVKVTGIARFDLLEKLDRASNEKSGYEGRVHTEVLSPEEVEEWNRVVNRMDRIIAVAAQKNVHVLIDAEETWIQDPVDAITMQMIEKYNRDRVIVYNTIQLYRHDRLSFMKSSVEAAQKNGSRPGLKLVRGAYMEKERKRAEELGYPSPIQPTKYATDNDYNEAVEYCIQHINDLAVIIASHNEESNLFATRLLDKYGISHNDSRVHFSQLYGMSDNITFNLAKAGFSVSKYLPFGPIGDVIPYLMRRAEENSSVSGQTGKELGLIKNELERRRGK